MGFLDRAEVILAPSNGKAALSGVAASSSFVEAAPVWYGWLYILLRCVFATKALSLFFSSLFPSLRAILKVAVFFFFSSLVGPPFRIGTSSCFSGQHHDVPSIFFACASGPPSFYPPLPSRLPCVWYVPPVPSAVRTCPSIDRCTRKPTEGYERHRVPAPGERRRLCLLRQQLCCQDRPHLCVPGRIVPNLPRHRPRGQGAKAVELSSCGRRDMVHVGSERERVAVLAVVPRFCRTVLSSCVWRGIIRVLVGGDLLAARVPDSLVGREWHSCPPTPASRTITLTQPFGRSRSHRPARQRSRRDSSARWTTSTTPGGGNVPRRAGRIQVDFLYILRQVFF